MASITSVISLFVLLLATYCYSVPIGQGYDFSTSNYEFSTDKTFGERESMPLYKSESETTMKPIFPKREMTGEYNNEFTTEFMTTVENEHEPREMNGNEFTTFAGEFSSPVNSKRTVDNENFNVVTAEYSESSRPELEIREMKNLEFTTAFGMPVEHEHKTREMKDDQFTTARMVPFEHEHKSREMKDNEFTTYANEFTSPMSPKRTVGDEQTDEFTTEFMTTMENEQQPREMKDDEFTTIASEFTSPISSKREVNDKSESESNEVTSERTNEKFVETEQKPRGVEDYSFTTLGFEASSEHPHHVRGLNHDLYTVESSTEFNNRASRVLGDEERLKMTTFEPSSSSNFFDKNTNLLHHQQVSEKPTSEYVRPGYQRLVKVEKVYPGQVTETKIYPNEPMKSYTTFDATTFQPLEISQGQGQKYFPKTN